MTTFSNYQNSFPNARLVRSESGVLEVTLHSDGGTLVFNGHTHEQFVDLFHAIGSDADNRVVILTGSGEAFMESISPDGFDFFTPRGYDKIYREGKKDPHEHSRRRGAADRRGERPGAAAFRIHPALRYRAGHAIEPGKQLMGREDADAAEEMQRVLTDEGIQLVLGAQPLKVHGEWGKTIAVTVRTEAGEQTIEGSDLLVAVGRVANTADIGLEKTEVNLDARGFIQVNERLETSAADIWAIGECAGSPQFTHVSVDDFRIVRDNMAGGNRRTDDRLVPYVMFTDPPLARVGLSESEAQRQGIDVRVAKLPMSNVLRTEATDETEGYMKVLVAVNDDRILGFTMIGSEAGEAMAAIQTAMLAGLPYTKLRDAVIAHLTIAEGFGPLLGNVPPRSAS